MTGRRALILAGSGMLSGVAEALVKDGWHVVLPSRRYSPIAVPEPKQGVAALKALRPRGHRPTGNDNGNDNDNDNGNDNDNDNGNGDADGGRQAGRALWVEAHWDRPRELSRKAQPALGGPADLMVAWVHEQYRRSMMGACEWLLAPRAPVVEVRGVGGPPVEPEPLLAAHPTQLVLVGSLSELDDSRPLSHAELTDAILGAVNRAVEGRAASLHQVGQSRPLVR